MNVVKLLYYALCSQRFSFQTFAIVLYLNIYKMTPFHYPATINTAVKRPPRR